MEILFIEPFERGYEAGIRGDDPRLCPYDRGTKEWVEWNRAQAIGAKLHVEARRNRAEGGCADEDMHGA